MTRYIIITIVLLTAAAQAMAGPFTLKGKVTDANGDPLEFATVSCTEQVKMTMTNLKGEYSIELQSKDSVVVRFSMVGYKTKTRTLKNPKGTQTLQIRLEESTELSEVVVVEKRRQTSQTEQLDIKDMAAAPSAGGNRVEEMIQTQAGVSTHNELSSQYNVRGGSFDENSVYINGTEVYRPLLIRSGQQEGLSAINPDMVEKIGFSTGGFEAQYGDKMSSALDITYKRPKKFEATAAASLLGASAYVGFSTKKVAWMNSVRYKMNRFLLGTGDTHGEYDPKFLDYQTYLVYTPNERWTLDVLGNISDNHYDFTPKDRETSFGTQQNVKQFKVYFDGWEKDLFRTFFGAASLTRHFGKDTNVKLQVAAFRSNEKETYDIQGQYWLTDTDNADELGVGTYMEHARNYLTSKVVSGKLSAEHKAGNHQLKTGLTLKHENISENSMEYEMRDSAGYSVPHTGKDLYMVYSLRSQNQIRSDRVEFYAQDTYRFHNAEETTFWTLNYGVRMSHWSLNKETLFSPRLSLAMVPRWNQDMTFRAATGLYYQAPFFKELRDTTTVGGVTYAHMNEKIKSQQSIHFLVGMDYRFKWLGERPFRFTAEAYYKILNNLIPYNVSNVKIVYYGENRCSGHIAGLDMKLFGEFVPGTDSWVTFSLMNTGMNLDGVSIPLPTDQRYSFNLYFTDYFPGTDRWRMSLKLAYADGLPFGPPHRGIERMQFRAPAYKRCDIGMSYLAYQRPENSHNLVRNVWVGLDCLNLFGNNNVNSYYWVTDVQNYQYAVPNYLTGRQVNLRVQIEV